MADGDAPLIALVGPTASGKSSLALRLANELNGEIISADSVQIYRHFDIGSGKPSTDELTEVPHHLIGSHAPDQDIDASVWAGLAEKKLHEIRGRGRRPIICGGTFLWLRALIYGLAKAPPKDDSIRARHAEWANRAGRAALHDELKTVDPKSAERLNPNDFIRVSRALEVFELTGKALSQFHAEHGFREAKHDVRLFGIQYSAEELTLRITARVEQMLELGWLDEVKELTKLGFRETRAMTSVGYRQVLASLDETATPDRDTLIADVTRVTRKFARRQRTWLRDEAVHWLSPEQASAPGVGDYILSEALKPRPT